MNKIKTEKTKINSLSGSSLLAKVSQGIHCYQ